MTTANSRGLPPVRCGRGRWPPAAVRKRQPEWKPGRRRRWRPRGRLGRPSGDRPGGPVRTGWGRTVWPRAREGVCWATGRSRRRRNLGGWRAWSEAWAVACAGVTGLRDEPGAMPTRGHAPGLTGAGDAGGIGGIGGLELARGSQKAESRTGAGAARLREVIRCDQAQGHATDYAQLPASARDGRKKFRRADQTHIMCGSALPIRRLPS